MKYYWAPLLLFLAIFPGPLVLLTSDTESESLRFLAAPQHTPGEEFTSLAIRFFGNHPFSYHLVSLLAVALTALLVQFFLLRYTRDRKIATLGAMLYLGYSLNAGAGQEGLTAYFITGALYCFLPAALADRKDHTRFGLMIFTGIFSALALLNGGWNALILLVVIEFAFLMYDRRLRDLLRLCWIPALTVVATVFFWGLPPVMARPGIELQFGENMRALFMGGFPAAFLVLCVLSGLAAKWLELSRLSYIKFCVVCLVVGGLAASLLGILPIFCMAPLAAFGAVGLAAWLRQGGHPRLLSWTMLTLGVGCFVVSALLYFGSFTFWPRESWMGLLPVGVALCVSSRGHWKLQMGTFFTAMALLVFFNKIIHY